MDYCFFNLASASANGLLNGSSSCLFCCFKYFCTSRLDTLLFFSFVRLSLKVESFSRCPHEQTKICPSPSPFNSNRLKQFGHLLFVDCEIVFRCPHSLSWQTNIFPLFPFTSSINFPQSGHFVLLILSCLNF